MLGDELRKARLAAKLTQEELAVKAKISREYVSQLERNTSSPTVETFLKLCRAMNISASRLIARLETK